MLEDILRSTLKTGSDSVASLIVGCCEGTRSPLGGFREAYYGHTDPGNGAKNMGSFSYQGNAAGPEHADVIWQEKVDKHLLPRFVAFWNSYEYRYSSLFVVWFNAVDLYTQAPLAVVAKAGLFDRLKAKPAESMSKLRADSFIDERGVLLAGGFNNDYNRLLADQTRRVSVINSFFQM